MDLSEIIPHIEALIFASEKPLTALDIVELINNAFGFMEERISLDQIEAAIEGIREKYTAEFYPFEIRESGGGFQFLTKKQFHKTVSQLNGDKFLKRLSNAALETLAIIAYKQPITKGEVEAIRGVNSDYSVQKLLEKELIIISGRNEELPGKPLVYSTSKSFMDYFGINSTADLPKIKEVLAEQSIQGTLIGDAINHGNVDEESQEGASNLIVADNGELIVQPISVEEDSNASQEDNIASNTSDNIEEETPEVIGDPSETISTETDETSKSEEEITADATVDSIEEEKSEAGTEEHTSPEDHIQPSESNESSDEENLNDLPNQQGN